MLMIVLYFQKFSAIIFLLVSFLPVSDVFRMHEVVLSIIVTKIGFSETFGIVRES